MNNFFYRLESENGIGPFRMEKTYSLFENYHSEENGFPNTYDDFGYIRYDKNLIHGVPTMGHFLEWFGPFLPELLKMNFKVKKIYAPFITSHTGKQVVAYRRQVENIIDITEKFYKNEAY